MDQLNNRIFSFLLLLTSFLVTGSINTNAQDSLWYWTADCPGATHGRLLNHISHGGSHFVFGRASNFDYLQPKSTFYSYTSGMQLQNSNCFEPDSLHEIIGAIRQKDGNFRLFGTAQQNGILNPYVAIISSKGELQFQNTLLRESPTVVGAVKKLRNGKILLSESRHMSSGVFNTVLSWMDEKNSFSILKQVEIISPFNEKPNKIIEDSKGNIYILCTRYKSADMGDFSSQVYKFNKKGNQIWTREYSATLKFSSHTLEIDENNNLYYAAGKKQKEAVMAFSMLGSLNEDGKFTKIVKVNDFLVSKILCTADDNLLLVGSETKLQTPFVIQKGKAIVMNKELLEGKTFILGPDHSPDSGWSKEKRNKLQSSSEYFGGFETNDGEIHLYGRVFFDLKNDSVEINTAAMKNRNLISRIFLN